jgi:hypothetical protein
MGGKTMRKETLVILLVYFAATVAFSAEVPVLIDAEALDPVVQPTDDGYAVAWWQGDARFGEGVRFARFDLTGQQIGETRQLGKLGVELFVDLRLEPVRGGFLLFVKDNIYALHSLPLDELGQPTGEVNLVIDSNDLWGVDVDGTSSSKLVVFPEFSLGFQVWSQQIDADGRPVKPRSRLSLATGNMIRDARLARTRSGYLSAWVEFSGAAISREIRKDGRPRGVPTEFVASQECPEWTDVAVSGGTQAVVYSAGCAQLDIFMRQRNKSGSFGDLIVLANEPFDEGTDPSFSPIEVAVGQDRFGLLYSALSQDLPYPYRGTWFLAEFDLAGIRIGEQRNLEDELSMDAWRGASLIYDEGRGQYVLSWSGFGPQGSGGYFVTLQPAP